MITADVLTLMQWMSPSFPVGAFAYSHGLETQIQRGAIATADQLHGWLEDVIAHGSGRSDAVLLRMAYGAEDLPALLCVEASAQSFAASAERLQETQLQGAAFIQTTAAVWPHDLPALTYPVAVGAVARHKGIAPDLTVSLYLHAFASNLMSVAVRAVPLGQTEGQDVLARLAPLCEDVARQTQTVGLEDLQSAAFLSDIAAMGHETLTHRIFRS